jgi:hypothetical protein
MAYAELWIGSTGVLNTPVLWINKYLQEQISGIFQNDNGEENATFPFFPSTPSTIDDLTDYFGRSTQGVAATWDRLIKMNRKGFPHIKCEQLLYYFYATGENPVEKMITIQESVLRLMDRFDETAEEINDWCSNRVIRVTTPTGTVDLENQFYFHNFKVYQLEETRDIIDFGTARTYGGNKIIIDFDYHQMPDLTASTWRPEPKPATKIVL